MVYLGVVTMTAKELIEKLQQFDPDAEVLATWEGITKHIDVYVSKDGIVLIDADDCFYQKQWQTEGVNARQSL